MNETRQLFSKEMEALALALLTMNFFFSTVNSPRFESSTFYMGASSVLFFFTFLYFVLRLTDIMDEKKTPRE